jgi:HK97 family phage major capsid protein/HK97 family phage prohead protease
MNRAYSILTVKAVEEEHRIIRGTATTPSPDRVGDIVEPLGVKFKNPMPLLWQHRSDKPVGTVTFDKPTKDGITFEAKLAIIDEPGTLKDRIDEAWQSVKAGLVSAVSIGFRAIEYAFIEGTGGIRFTESEVMELSLVTIPANADATISQIKSIDAPLLAATGKEPKATDRPVPPGASGTSTKTVKLLKPKEKPMATKTIAEQISAFEATRAAKAAELETVMTTTEGETLDAESAEAADALGAEIKAIDDHLKRLRLVESLKAGTAKPVKDVATEKDGATVRSGIVVKAPEVHKPGMQFARVVKCLALAHKQHRDPIVVATDLYGGGNQEVVEAVKAAVAAQSTTSATLGGNLIATGGVFADFVEFLRPMTIIGKFGTGNIPSLRNVPFRVPLGSSTSGGSAAWVGEGKAKPLTNFNFGQTTLLPLKVAAIVVATMELLRDASVAGEAMFRDLLAAAVAERIDIDFIDPAKAASAGVSPASITNGVTPIPASGTGTADDMRTDFQALMATYIANNNPPSSAVWIMPTMTALAASLMNNPLGQSEFPGISMTGGALLGIPAIVSDYMTSDSGGADVAMVNARDIWLGDEGGIEVRASNEASLQMDDAPTQSSVATVTATSTVSMFQTNSVAILAERTINWAKRRPDAVALLSNVNWGA